MNVKAVVLVLFPCMGSAQGFAGLGTSAEDFAVPTLPAEFSFPSDHGPHPDYRIEWWYLTANLTDEDGTDYGLQWTLFRTALATDDTEGWSSPQLWMGHAADDWQLAGDDFDHLRMTASGSNFAYDLNLSTEASLIFHGDNGYSVKSADGQASYYYSQPFYAVEGVLTLPEGDVAVTGQAWLDREWSSQPLSEDQTGWDWFSLSLDTGKLMGFRLRRGISSRTD